ncbi:hypothetical protein [Streptomyces sp. NBC_01237]|uniref:hypothetical protein n=1 Tax=Streptomyces sp. NBC_01237 TaxID=2903790 RepID=UPI002DDC3904|nr:hypothetical protein [Streptomyces sp. NBC_01237]WRZ78728.1 hypothetical protein OG251_44695 [Streptomyces sp. NBC_01237]
MAASRHHRTDQTPDQIRQDIKNDIAASRREQRELQAAGNHRAGEAMRQETDRFVDELSDLNAGRWTPQHAA